MLRNLMQLYPNAPEGGAEDTAVDTATDTAADTAPQIDPDKYRKALADAERREKLLKEAQERLAKIDADAEKQRQAELEAKGEFDKVKTELQTKIDELTAKTAEQEKALKAIQDAKQADLDKLTEQLTDEQKGLLTGNLDADLKLARHFTAENEQPPGPNNTPAPGGKLSKTNEQKRKAARENRDMQGFYESMPVIATVRGD